MPSELARKPSSPFQLQGPGSSLENQMGYNGGKYPIEVDRAPYLDNSTTSTSFEIGGAPNSTDKDPQYITGIQLYMVEFAATLAALLLFLDTAIIATAIPRITDEFHSLSDVGWYGGAYQLGSAALVPLSGKIYHHFSTKWAYLCFFGVFELGSLLCGAARSSAMLITGRTIAGMGSAGVITGALTIIAGIMPIEKRPLATGILIGFSQIGIVAGPLLGGALTEKTTWRWCFYINLPLGAVCALILSFIRIPDQIEKPRALSVLPRLHHHLDLLGFILFAGCVVELLTALEFGGNQYAWNSATTIGLFCGAGVTFLAWYAWNRRLGDSALIPLSMASKTPVWTSSVMQGLSMGSLFIITYFLPIYFQAVQDASPLSSGVQLLPTIVSQLIFTVLSGILVSKTGFTIPYAVLGTALGAIGTGLCSTLDPYSSMGKWFGFQVIAGAGRGMAMQMPIIAIQASLNQHDVAMANALLYFTQSLFVAILVVVGNTLLDGSLRTEIAKHVPTANVEDILMAGATGYRSVVSLADLPGVVLAYANSLDRVFYVSAATSSVALFVSLGMGWVDIRKKAPAPGASTSASGENDMTAATSARDQVELPL